MGSLSLDCCVDWLFTPEAEAPPKRRATLIPRAPALGCLHWTRISPRRSSCGSAPWSHIQLIFSVFPGAIRSRRAEKIDSTRKESDIESANERETECNEEWKPDVVPLTEDSGPHLPILGGLDVFTVNVSIMGAVEFPCRLIWPQRRECRLAWPQSRGHLRLIDKRGLFMYNFFFLLKISRCGLFIGALYSPEITVHNSQWTRNAESQLQPLTRQAVLIRIS